jgi:hypothetical protein
MKLYSSVCLGLLVIFFCGSEQPKTVSDFCKLAGPEMAKMAKLTDAEIAALARPRKEAILALRRKHAQLCK